MQPAFEVTYGFCALKHCVKPRKWAKYWFMWRLPCGRSLKELEQAHAQMMQILKQNCSELMFSPDDSFKADMKQKLEHSFIRDY